MAGLISQSCWRYDFQWRLSIEKPFCVTLTDSALRRPQHWRTGEHAVIVCHQQQNSTRSLLCAKTVAQMHITRLCCPNTQQPYPCKSADHHRGNVCPVRATRATFLLTIPTSAPDLPSLGEATQVDHVGLHTFPTKHVANKAIAVISTTPNVICIVLNKQHWSHKCGCQYIQHMFFTLTTTCDGGTLLTTQHTLTLLPHPLPHLAWWPSCFC